jgi:integrase
MFTCSFTWRFVDGTYLRNFVHLSFRNFDLTWQVLTNHDETDRQTDHVAWKLASPHSPAILQITLSSVNMWLSLRKSDCFCTWQNETLLSYLTEWDTPFVPHRMRHSFCTSQNETLLLYLTDWDTPFVPYRLRHSFCTLQTETLLQQFNKCYAFISIKIKFCAVRVVGWGCLLLLLILWVLENDTWHL